MKFGICFDAAHPERLAIVRQAGLDYTECNYAWLSRAPEAEIEAYSAALAEHGLRNLSANCFMPGDLPLLGENFRADAVRDYVRSGLERGRKVGLEKIVFGSGGARSIPEGLPYESAVRQLTAVLRDVIAPLLEEYAVTLTIEPLRKAECNFINTVKEGAMLAAAVDRSRVAVLADLYHMICGGDTYEDLRQLKGALRHAHISNPAPKNTTMNRIYPRDPQEYDYRGFIDALAYAGVDTCSIEAGCEDFETDLMRAGKCLAAFR